jgi:hypothetical protein
VHGQAGFRPRICARRATRAGGQGLAIHGLTPSSPSPGKSSFLPSFRREIFVTALSRHRTEIRA